MQYIVDSQQMKAIDQFTIEKIGIPSLVLMERAALAVSNNMLRKISKKDSILAICGTGNNGADGIAVARILMLQGNHVDIYIIGDEKRGSDAFRQQLRIAKNVGINVINNAKISEYNVIIDAIFGIGLNKKVTGSFETVILEVNANNNVVYSVDIPSGINASCGKVEGTAIQADYTISFGYYKMGQILYPGCEFMGELEIVDIGYPKEVLQEANVNAYLFEDVDLNRLPKRKNRSNKGDYGRVLVIAGTKNMSGACYLSAMAAYRTGAGLVKVLTVEDNRSVIQTKLPEAIVITYEPTNLKSKIEIDRIVREIEWATAIVIGPGIGISAASDCLLDLVLKNAKIPVIIDADGINMLAHHSEYVFEDDQGKRKIDLPGNVILTPHLKEMSRLLDCDTAYVKDNLLSIAQSVTNNKEFVLALKDARTLVSNGKELYVNVSGNNGMSTGGSGDVLTGILAALVAQGLTPNEAACIGVYIHGRAGDHAREQVGTYSLMASDIINAIPFVMK
ncbi:NAD(P)HX epimerase / NAD(P)HX dehydratase [Lachnospiraceae bacterium KM106-2]|nr:NAD(P)HX epimerase / NAD(P)HX dehydratase [Lachnospiraceae bacterium KM106-2]